jgi:hypothetical protein
MMRIVTGAAVATWVMARFGLPEKEKSESIGLMRDGEIVAGVVFWNFNGFDIEATVASIPGGNRTRLVRAVGEYCFDQLKCTRISVTTADANTAELAFRMGGVLEGVKADYNGPGTQGFCIGILKNAWRFGRVSATTT